MNKKLILIVDDEAPIRKMIGFALEQAGYSHIEAADAHQAQKVIAQSPPDLILLDLMLPGMSGIELAKRLKTNDNTRDIPIIMLTARAEEDTKVTGLESGADDYMVKPISPRELVARIKAVLRRGETSPEKILEIGSLKLEPAKHRVSIDDKILKLGPTEYRLLHFLMSHPERVYNREQLLDQVWGDKPDVDERTVDVHVRRLRKILEEHSCEHLIQTVRSAGYRFSEKE